MEDKKYLTSLLTLGAFALPALGLAYLTPRLYRKYTKTGPNPQKVASIADSFNKFVVENNLVHSDLYKDYSSGLKNEPAQYLDIGILKEGKGFDYLEVLYERHFYEMITKEVVVTPEEKKKLEETAKLYFFFVPNKTVQKQKGTLHSGVVFTLLDNMCGCELACVVNNFGPIVTAYLNTQYHKPMEVDKGYICIAEVDKIQGRKIFIKAKIIDLTGELYVSMDSLYITIETDTLPKMDVYKQMVQEREIQKQEGGSQTPSQNGSQLIIG